MQKERLQITFIAEKGFAKTGYTAWYPKDEAQAYIDAGYAKAVEEKETRHITEVENTSRGGTIKKLTTKAGGKE